MIDRDLQKHAAEFRGYLRTHKYDVTDEGILLPRETFFNTSRGQTPLP